ncbi:MAG: hypothetical protein JW768_09730, partial [Chitinispirillaceae bacterium]|nr:hypothetical protein [Chitinispirillaceae bacterium]
MNPVGFLSVPERIAAMKLSDCVPRNRHDRNRLLIVAAALVFLYIPSRIVLLTVFTPIGSDVDLYARYAYIYRLAQEKKTDFYDLYRETGMRDSLYSCYSLRDLTEIPYPPLAIHFLAIPTPFVLHGRTAVSVALDDFVPRYHAAYRRLCALVEMTFILAGLCVIMVLFRGERLVETIMRSGMLCGAGVLLPHVIFDRLDVVLAALLLLSLAALLSRHWLISFFLLACAVHFKPVPVFLIPLWIYGSMACLRPGQASGTQRIMGLASIFCVRTGVLTVMIGALAVPFMVADGPEAFGFLSFHAQRGIHIESTWGTAAMLLGRLFHVPFQIVYDFGAFNVAITGADTLSRIATAVLVAAIIIYAAMIGWRMLRYRQRTTGGLPLPVPPIMTIVWTCIFLGTIFCVFKMFSPQFLLLLVPLVALVPFTGL